jgi:hypothetical protein
MTTARHYISFLLDFCFDWDVPLSEPVTSRTDDIAAAIYSSLLRKRCIVCGIKGEIHHVDSVGMGRNRQEIAHIGMRVMCLCRYHHSECHAIGQEFFDIKYHIYGIIADSRICEVYRLNKVD